METSATVARWNMLQRVIRQRDALAAALRNFVDKCDQMRDLAAERGESPCLILVSDVAKAREALRLLDK